jgi:hypothetical protein
LVKSAIDGVVVVDDEATYNNMNQAMRAMNSKLFLKRHLSYYTDKDLEIIDCYKTKPICLMLYASPVNNNLAKSLIEIDVSMANTSAFNDIVEIPICNEFNAFEPYDGEAVLPVNLYVVQDFERPLSTQNHSLVYDKYLKEGMCITALTQPSCVKEVDYYATLVEELYATKI